MRNAVLVAGEVGALPDDPDYAVRLEAISGEEDVSAKGTPARQARVQLEKSATTLRELRPVHRKKTLSSVAGGAVTADEAIARVDNVRRLEALAHHARSSAAQLLAAGASSRAESAL